MAEREVSYVWVDDPKGLRDAVKSISSATRLGVDTYQVVDRFTPTGNPIVEAYETLEEAERVRDELRAKRLKEVR